MTLHVALMLASTALLACGAHASQASTPSLASEAASFRHASVQLSTGVRMHYVEQGRQDGPVLVLLHGYTDSYLSFERVLPLLPRSFHVYALDQRGHGDSSRPDCCYSQSDFASDVAAFLDSQGIPRAVLVGHSMGSFIAQQVALEHPQRVEALVLVGSAPTVHGNAVAAELKSVVDTLSDPIDPAFVREFQAGTFYRPIPPSFLDTAVSESLKVPARVWKAALDGLIAEDHSSRLRDLSVPTLVVGGDHDGFFSVPEQQALAQALPHATLALYTETGHAPHVELPERFVEDVKRFLHSLRAE
ncbi:pimeloyl-ACP methyl ester carboxylesterase [Archangium gephyra]|uniref:Biotin synthesis protein BioH n=1 Tax=Archangium gephyra TaxID=48 RepID=A0AAC8Q1R2_9BACT|nr:alpha/beta hydrolase [Archangium gephyra]AKI99225.1 Biotin synthesis protein BioH [Archangium gephyra]REG31130.1 pimeloyl-ACP methyl ester carboxylesterase [Archangium gephyra]